MPDSVSVPHRRGVEQHEARSSQSRKVGPFNIDRFLFEADSPLKSYISVVFPSLLLFDSESYRNDLTHLACFSHFLLPSRVDYFCFLRVAQKRIEAHREIF